VDAEGLVLHALVIKGFASSSALSVASELTVDDVEAVLAGLRARDLAVYREGRVTGWAPTAEARRLDRERTALIGSDREAVLNVYQRFAAVNGRFKQACTDWQLRDGTTPNDHGDAAYDASVIARLAAIDDEAGRLCAELEAALPRAARYRGRLAEARRAVETGDPSRFVKPLNESYHDVWMELHQDLLVSLQLERTANDA
jgi:hypothetical protein